MSFSAANLYSLLPSIYRIRDKEQGYVLRELIDCLAEQVNAIEEDIEQLYDDQFIETCAPWVVPYIGDLIGFRESSGTPGAVSASRKQVANLIDFRRRKGTADALEDQSSAIANRAVVVVEFFRRLAVTQNLNHLRPGFLGTPDLRAIDALVWANTAFDMMPRTAGISLGMPNIANLGVFIWRQEAFSMRETTPLRVDARRFLFHPLGLPQPLFMNPEPEAPGELLEERTSVPQAIPLRAAFLAKDYFYGRERSFWVERGGSLVPVGSVRICDLSDDGAGWGNMPSSGIAIDTERGRLAFSEDVNIAATPVNVSFFYGFHSRIGGGEYDRAGTLAPVSSPALVPTVHPAIGSAVAAVAGNGVVEIAGSGRYEEAISVQAGPSGSVELRAANRSRPVIVLSGEMTIGGTANGTVTLNGLTFAGANLRVPAASTGLRRLHLIDCTLVPGQSDLIVEAPNVELIIERCVLGTIQVETDSDTNMQSSFAASYGGIAGAPGGPLTAEKVTIFGTTHTLRLERGSNSIFAGVLTSMHVQKGCARYSYIAPGSRSPRRYLCQPVNPDDLSAGPRFLSLRYGNPSYGQLHRFTCSLIRTGAEDGGEMGACHDLFEAAREEAVCRTFEEFVPLGMEARLLDANETRMGRSK